MKKSLFSISMLLLLAFAFTACENNEDKDKGTCETNLVNYEGYRIYFCAEDVDEYYCDGNSDDYRQSFYSNSSCVDLGYSYQDSDDNWFYSSSNNVTPGAYGSWGSGSGDAGGGSTPDDGLPSYCDGSYSGPSADPQVDGFCQAAFAAICSGYSPSSSEVKSYCDIFDAFGVSYSCPYCN